MKDTLGDRIKGYESIYEHYFLPKIPIIVRIDGKAFHTQVKKWNCEKPFDQTLINCMFATAKDVAANIQGCKALYAQSDEVTFVLTDDAAIDTQQWFGGRQNKIESVTAAMMTAYFNKFWVENEYGDGYMGDGHVYFDDYIQNYKPAIFDARAFQCPKDDVANVFLWRVKDWERNSLNMYCEQFFSHKELQGKNRADRHEMLHKIGHNWANECTDQQKNGSWWSCDKVDNFNLTNYQDIDDYIFRDGIAYAISKEMQRENLDWMNGLDLEVIKWDKPIGNEIAID
jgi:tRNA(His) 5'-end guanylyltransferase